MHSFSAIVVALMLTNHAAKYRLASSYRSARWAPVHPCFCRAALDTAKHALIYDAVRTKAIRFHFNNFKSF